MLASPPLRVGRTLLRARWISWVLLAAFVATGGGISIAAASAARRTDSALTRFLHRSGAADFTVDLPANSANAIATIERLPHVGTVHVSAGLFAFRVLKGEKGDFTGIDQVLASVDGRFLTSERPALAAGRLPDPRRADEAFITVAAAHRTGLRVGSIVRLAMFDERHPPADPATAAANARQASVRVVGIATMTDEVVQDDIARDYRIVVTPAFYRKFAFSTSFTRAAIRLTDGARGVAATERRISRLAGGDVPFEDEHDIAARTQRAIRPTVLALSLFSLLAAFVTAFVIGQAIARQTRASADELNVLRALGFDRRQLMQTVCLAPVVTIAAGVLGAVVVSAALSPLGPVGVARSIEPRPGLAFDGLALSAGSALLFAILLIPVGVSALRAVALTRHHRGRSVGGRARLAPATTRFGVAAAVGVGMATGRTDRGTSVRATFGAIVATMLFLTIVVTFGAGLRDVVGKPRLYGWNWDSAIQLSGGYGLVQRGPDGAGPITAHALASIPGVEAASSVRFAKLTVDGQSESAIGVRPFLGRVDLAIALGRSATRDGEVVLGRTTAAHMHVHIGSDVSLADGATKQSARVVGTAVFPALGQVDAERTGLGEGVELTGTAMAHLVPLDPYDPLGPHDRDGRGSDNGLIIRYDRGADPSVVTRALQHRFGAASEDSQVVGPQRSAELVDYRNFDRTPAILLAVLTLAALAALAQSIWAGVRDRRRDIAVLKTLGFTRRQVASTVAWQATAIALAAIVVGIPLGVAVGRQLWTLYARQVGVLALPVTPIAALGAIAILAVLLANIVARFPARAAARVPAAEVLHAE